MMGGRGREGLGRENAIFQGKVPGTMERGAARVIQSLRDSDCGVDRTGGLEERMHKSHAAFLDAKRPGEFLISSPYSRQ
jgi:hypothetical protein